MEVCPYWTQEDYQAAERAVHFWELGELLFGILGRMEARNPGKTIGIVSGPMTTGGWDERTNREVMRRSIVYLRAEGYLVLDQMPLGPHVLRLYLAWKAQHEGSYCHDILGDIYYRLIGSGRIGRFWSLRKWLTSEGARGERRLAGMTRGVDILDYPDYLYQRIVRELGLSL